MNLRLQFRRIAAFVPEGTLGDDAAAVERGIHPMNRHAEDLHAVLQRLLDGVRPAEGGQQ